MTPEERAAFPPGQPLTAEEIRAAKRGAMMEDLRWVLHDCGPLILIMALSTLSWVYVEDVVRFLIAVLDVARDTANPDRS